MSFLTHLVVLITRHCGCVPLQCPEATEKNHMLACWQYFPFIIHNVCYEMCFYLSFMSRTCVQEGVRILFILSICPLCLISVYLLQFCHWVHCYGNSSTHRCQYVTFSGILDKGVRRSSSHTFCQIGAITNIIYLTQSLYF